MNIDALYGLSTLKTLRLDRCLLRVMPPIGHVKDTLQTLMITKNSITHIPNGYFDDLTQLITISLSNNYLTLFPDVSPVRQTLITLSISSNYIPQIPHFIFDNAFNSLRHLMIGDNIIHSLPSNFLTSPACNILLPSIMIYILWIRPSLEDNMSLSWWHCLVIHGGVIRLCLGCAICTLKITALWVSFNSSKRMDMLG